MDICDDPDCFCEYAEMKQLGIPTEEDHDLMRMDTDYDAM